MCGLRGGDPLLRPAGRGRRPLRSRPQSFARSFPLALRDRLANSFKRAAILCGFNRFVRLGMVDFRYPFQGVDLTDRLVFTNAQDAWEAQGEAAIVPV